MLNNVLQIVDAVEVGVSQFADLWFNVARDGDIHQQHRLVTPRLKRTLHHAFADDRQRAGGGADNDVGLFQPFVDIAEGYHLGAHFLRQRLGAFTGAVGDHHFAHVMFAKMARYQLNGFPGADQ